MRGFTLIESVVYIALFALVMSGALTGIEAITESGNRSQTHALLETEGNFLLAKISAISNPSSELQLTGTKLFHIHDGEPIQLSSDSVQVSHLSVSNTSLVSFQLSAFTNNGQDITEAFQGSSYLFP